MDSTNKKDMSAICFSQITTYGELLQALPATGPGNVPSLGFLHQNAKVVLHAKTENGMIEVYDNGYYTYLENDRITVNAVDRCGELKWYTNTGETLVSKDIDLVGLPWTVPLEIAGVNKLAINALMREQSKTIYSLDAPASRDNPHFSIQSEYEARTEENAIAESQENRIILARNILKELSEREREIIQMLYVEGMTQADAAEKAVAELNVLHREKHGSIELLITRDSAERIAEVLAPAKPLLLDVLPLSLEEVFIYELGGEKYDFSEIL